MKKPLQAWRDEIVGIDLPVFDETLQALNQLQNEPADANGERIASVVLADPMMVLKAMRMANSGRSGRFVQPILTIEHAVMMVGLSPSFDKMMACKPYTTVMSPEACAGMRGIAARAYHAAYHARDWAVWRLDINVQEVYIAALLQELAAMVMWVIAPETIRAIEKSYRKHSRHEAELSHLGFTLDELTLELAQAWNLPPLIHSALLEEECDAHARARLVALTRHLAHDAEMGWYGKASLLDVARLAETLRISEDEILCRIHRVAVDCARSRSFEGVTPAATWLPMLPGEWPDDEFAAKPEPQTIVDHYEQAMTEIAAHLDGTMTLTQLMKLVLQGMQHGINLKRVVFALLTQDRKQLRARFIIGAEEQSSLRQFQFDLAQPNLFSKLLEKQQAFWLNDEVRPKVARMLDAELQRITASGQFYAMSVAVHGKVIGLFYGDAGEGHHPLNTDGYDRFKKLCTQASVAMAHLAKS